MMMRYSSEYVVLFYINVTKAALLNMSSNAYMVSVKKVIAGNSHKS